MTRAPVGATKVRVRQANGNDLDALVRLADSVDRHLERVVLGEGRRGAEVDHDGAPVDLVERGCGGPASLDGYTAIGGVKPVNTSGGGLSYCHPGMYGLLVMIEAIRQVRGECGQRQVKGCDVALAQGNGGVLSSECTVIFGSESTL